MIDKKNSIQERYNADFIHSSTGNGAPSPLEQEKK